MLKFETDQEITSVQFNGDIALLIMELVFGIRAVRSGVHEQMSKRDAELFDMAIKYILVDGVFTNVERMDEKANRLERLNGWMADLLDFVMSDEEGTDGKIKIDD